MSFKKHTKSLNQKICKAESDKVNLIMIYIILICFSSLWKIMVMTREMLYGPTKFQFVIDDQNLQMYSKQLLIQSFLHEETIFFVVLLF